MSSGHAGWRKSFVKCFALYGYLTWVFFIHFFCFCFYFIYFFFVFLRNWLSSLMYFLHAFTGERNGKVWAVTMTPLVRDGIHTYIQIQKLHGIWILCLIFGTYFVPRKRSGVSCSVYTYRHTHTYINMH